MPSRALDPLIKQRATGRRSDALMAQPLHSFGVSGCRARPKNPSILIEPSRWRDYNQASVRMPSLVYHASLLVSNGARPRVVVHIS